MTYFVEVLLDRVVCREPESDTGPDLFSLVTSIATKKHFTKDDADAWVKVHELKRIRRGDSENYSKVIFKGFATEPTLYLVLLGFDIDRNSIWADNEDEIRKKADAAEGKIKEGVAQDVAEGDYLGFIRRWIVEATDIIISMDRNDRVLDASELFPLSGAPFSSSISVPLEIKTKNPDEVGADYSVHLVVTYGQTVPAFSDVAGSEYWVECKTPNTESERDNWIGRWTAIAGDPKNVAVEILISANTVYKNLLDVSVTEVDTKTQTKVSATTTEAVPISRVFVEMSSRVASKGATRRVLESESTGFSDTLQTPAHLGASSGIKPTIEVDSDGPYVSRYTLETSFSNKFVSKFRLAGSDIGTEKIAVREQIGPDILWLRNQAIVEIYRIVENGNFVGRFGLIYLRTVTNPLYREGTFEVVKRLIQAAR